MQAIKALLNREVPYDLLYLADESDDGIAVYRETAHFFGAFTEQKLAGTVGLSLEPDGTAEIVSLAVYPQYEGRGMGTALVERAIEEAQTRGCSRIIVKTGNGSMKLLYLYQSCGFRIDHVNHDYFIQHCERPIYEDNLPCRDQVVLSCQLYTPGEQKSRVQQYWQRFTERHKEYCGASYEVWGFGYGIKIPNQLIGLVKTEQKTATSSALELVEPHEKIPAPGDISVITYGNGLPGCIIKTIAVEQKAFRDILPEEAALEGEGDLSLDHWHRVHRYFFTKEYTAAGKTFHEEIPVLFEQFTLIYDEDRHSGL